MDMKHLNEIFTDQEFEQLKQAKDKMNWHDFLMSYATKIIRCVQCGHPIPQCNSIGQMNPVWAFEMPFCSEDCFGKSFQIKEVKTK